MLGTGSPVEVRGLDDAYEIRTELGSGGQGVVYEVQRVAGDRRLALKWFWHDSGTRSQARRLQRMFDRGQPGPEFLWPLAFAGSGAERGWGYVMELREERFVPLSAVTRGERDLGLRTTCTVGAEVTKAMLRLHALGLCYADVSVNNLFVDPVTGDVAICDNDNVVVDGEPSDVLGTPSYMAPEILRGEANPSIDTDRHSIAIILFNLLLRGHPLYGRRHSLIPSLDYASLQELLGRSPVFVFDEADDSNRPVEAVHDNVRIAWPALPERAKRLFDQAFTVGLREPATGRVLEWQWLSLLRDLRRLVRTCPHCGTEQFWDPEEPNRVCAEPSCGVRLDPPVRASIGETVVVLEPGATITTADLPGGADEEPARLADVVRLPDGAIAIRNRSDAPWPVATRDGGVAVKPRAAARINHDLRLVIGGHTVQIER